MNTANMCLQKPFDMTTRWFKGAFQMQKKSSMNLIKLFVVYGHSLPYFHSLWKKLEENHEIQTWADWKIAKLVIEDQKKNGEDTAPPDGKPFRHG